MHRYQARIEWRRGDAAFTELNDEELHELVRLTAWQGGDPGPTEADDED